MRNLKYSLLTGVAAAGLVLTPVVVQDVSAKTYQVEVKKESQSVVKKIETLQHLEEMISDNENFVACISATWCGPCEMYAPIYEEVAKKYEGKVVFGKFLTEKGWGEGEFGKIFDKYGLKGVPTTMMFKNGKEIKRIHFAVKKNLRRMIDKYFFNTF